MAAMREEAKAEPAAPEKDDKDEAAEGAQAKPTGGRRKLLIIGAIALLVAGIAAASRTISCMAPRRRPNRTQRRRHRRTNKPST